jgi:hypothetical protein
MPAATDAAASTAKATAIDAVRLLPDELLNNWWLNLQLVVEIGARKLTRLYARCLCVLQHMAASAQKCALLAGPRNGRPLPARTGMVLHLNRRTEGM